MTEREIIFDRWARERNINVEEMRVMISEQIEKGWNNHGKFSIVWRCCTHVEHGPEGYDAPTIQESDVQAVVVINLTLGNRDSILTTLKKNVEAVGRSTKLLRRALMPS